MYFKIKSKSVKQIYLCTTNNKVDDKFEDVCKLHKIKYLEEAQTTF